MSQSPEEPWPGPRNGKFTPLPGWVRGNFPMRFAACFSTPWLLVSHAPGHTDTGLCPAATLQHAPGLCLELCLSARVSAASGIALTGTELPPSPGWVRLLQTRKKKQWKIQGKIFFFFFVQSFIEVWCEWCRKEVLHKVPRARQWS